MPLPTNISFDAVWRLSDILNAISTAVNGKAPQTLAAVPATPPAADGHSLYVSAAAPWSLPLPDATLCKGGTLSIFKTDANANAITLVPQAAPIQQTINGANTNAVLLAAQYAHCVIHSDGTNWLVFVLS